MKANTESERESKELNNKIVVCLGKGGQRDMAHTYIHPLGMIHQLQEAHNIVKIVQGLTNTHENNV